MYVPASDERKTKKAASLRVDTIVFDLEDGVALNQKVCLNPRLFLSCHKVHNATREENIGTWQSLQGMFVIRIDDWLKWCLHHDCLLVLSKSLDWFILSRTHSDHASLVFKCG